MATLTTISKQTKSLFSIKTHTSMKILLLTSPSVLFIKFRKNLFEKKWNSSSKLPNRSCENKRHFFIGQSPWKINWNLYDFESFEEKIDQKEWISAKKRNYYRILESGRMWGQWGKLYHSKKVALRWRGQSQVVNII